MTIIPADGRIISRDDFPDLFTTLNLALEGQTMENCMDNIILITQNKSSYYYVLGMIYSRVLFSAVNGSLPIDRNGLIYMATFNKKKIENMLDKVYSLNDFILFSNCYSSQTDYKNYSVKLYSDSTVFDTYLDTKFAFKSDDFARRYFHTVNRLRGIWS